MLQSVLVNVVFQASCAGDCSSSGSFTSWRTLLLCAAVSLFSRSEVKDFFRSSGNLTPQQESSIPQVCPPSGVLLCPLRIAVIAFRPLRFPSHSSMLWPHSKQTYFGESFSVHYLNIHDCRPSQPERKLYALRSARLVKCWDVAHTTTDRDLNGRDRQSTCRFSLLLRCISFKSADLLHCG